MTEKSLDEKVAEALGMWLILSDHDTPYLTIKHNKHWYPVSGFFTQSIVNCKKYIEPILFRDSNALNQEFDYSHWWITIHGKGDSIVARGDGSTEEIAYCNALLNLKEREK